MAADDRREFVMIDELQPSVLVAGWWHFNRCVDWAYRVAGMHFILVESGEIEATIDGRRMIARAGQMVCFPPMLENHYRAPASTKTFQMQVQFSPTPRTHLLPWLDELGPLPPIVDLSMCVPQARKLFESICVLLPSAWPGNRLRVRSSVLELLALMSSAVRPTSTSWDLLDPMQLARLKLESNLDSPIAIRELARQLRLKPRDLAREFRKRFDMSPQRARTLARVREAARLLVSTNSNELLIKQIAAAVGFSDAKFFARTFHKVMGFTPTEMRQGKSKSLVESSKPSRTTVYDLNTHILPPERSRDWVNSLIISCT